MLPAFHERIRLVMETGLLMKLFDSLPYHVCFDQEPPSILANTIYDVPHIYVWVTLVIMKSFVKMCHRLVHTITGASINSTELTPLHGSVCP